MAKALQTSGLWYCAREDACIFCFRSESGERKRKLLESCRISWTQCNVSAWAVWNLTLSQGRFLSLARAELREFHQNSGCDHVGGMRCVLSVNKISYALLKDH